MEKIETIALSIPGSLDPSLAVAGSRAGGTGVLNLEFSQDSSGAIEGLRKLARYAGGRFGVKFSGYLDDFSLEVAANLPDGLGLVILGCTAVDHLTGIHEILRRRKVIVLLECGSSEEALLGKRLGVDGIIAKGHEAGGRVGRETSFILLQRFLKSLSMPVYAQGGIGLNTAAACRAAGAAGIVLDSQLALCRESGLPGAIRARITALDGSETLCMGDGIGVNYRFLTGAGSPVIKALQEMEDGLAAGGPSPPDKAYAWHRAFSGWVGWNKAGSHLIPLGQDVAFAEPLAASYATVGGVLQAIRRAAEENGSAALRYRPLAEGSPLAQSHGTRYPIVQGPMARVSDSAAFCARVVEGGALPFVAAAWMRAPELRDVLRETGSLVKGKPWGVGLMGFLPLELYREQVRVLLEAHPPFALIAGARHGQARSLEREGIATYVHVPSPGLLGMFLEEGLHRFVFEGRESGGHVGPLCSFVLWETLISLFLKRLPSAASLEKYHVLFAGGIKDALSAAMVSVMAAPLAERGARVGVQLGTAYLFTEEAVAAGAIVAKYQEEALRCGYTTLLETGIGHAVRCIDTPFAGAFRQEKRRLIEEGISAEERQKTLEKMKLGRLRIAAKGLGVNPLHGREAKAPRLVPLSPKDQLKGGVYMVGQLAALQDQPLTIQELHHDIAVTGSEKVTSASPPRVSTPSGGALSRPSDIAVIGLGGFFPGASDVPTYWENILNRVNAIREIPPERWDWRLYYEGDRHARDRVYSKWGGFLDDVPFDPVRYGMPPNTIPSVEPLQLLTLEAVRAAMEDAGYGRRPFAKERTSVVLGISGVGELAQLYGFRTALPIFFGEGSGDIISHFTGELPEWTEDSFPGILANVAAGRVANRFDLGGLNCTVDAACASSLAAVYLAVKELEVGASDMVVVGGADCMQNPFTYMCFSKTQALSPRGVCNALDENADGIVIGEAVAVMILKRLSDAERDGDRIYAVLKGIGASSDGRDRSLTAPGRDGQMRALERAYTKARVKPSQVRLIEAHATGTAEGDRVEIESLTRFFGAAGARSQGCAIGSVKSVIGHSKSTAGLASLMKAVLSLYHKVLPPTMGVERPNPVLRLPDSPFYVNKEPRPWSLRVGEEVRRAGVSAFGFGGTNYHAVLEEYTQDYLDAGREGSYRQWPNELFFWHGQTREEVVEAFGPLVKTLSQGAGPRLGDLAFTCRQKGRLQRPETTEAGVSLAVVASSTEDLQQKLDWAAQELARGVSRLADPRGVYYTEEPLASKGAIAFLFPGQGSQYVNMLADLLIQFPELGGLFEEGNRVLQDRLPQALTDFIFPPSAFSEEERAAQAKALADTRVAQPAMGTADLALFHLLDSLGIRPHMVAGHSYGEYAALCAAGVIKEEDLLALSEARARFILEGAGEDPGTMAAVSAGTDRVGEIIEGIEGVWIANVNAPGQTVITGTGAGVREAVERLGQAGVAARSIPVSCAFHSPIVAPAGEPLKAFMSGLPVTSARVRVFSNTTAGPYPEQPDAVKDLLLQHLTSRVDFVGEIEGMYAEGARVFVEVGPGRVLTGLVGQILGDRPHVALPVNQSDRSGLTQLLHLMAQLIAHGVPVDADRIFEGRGLKEVDLDDPGKESAQAGLSATTWLVNGAAARPLERESTASRGRRTAPYPLQAAEKTPGPSKDVQTEIVPGGQAAPREAGRARAVGVSPSQAGSCGRATFGAPCPAGGARDEAVLGFQRLMQRFLETQKRIMTQYLQGREADPAAMSETARAVPLEGPHPQERPEERPRKDDGPEVHGPDTLQGQDGLEEQDGPERQDSPQGRDARVSRLLRIVSERTGYPREMLDLNLDLEAELGIDSIKRVEILGQFLKVLFPGEQGAPPEVMDRLQGVRNLGDIIDRLEASSLKGPEMEPEERSPAPEGGTAEAPPQEAGAGKSLPRFTLRPVVAPPPECLKPLSPDRVLLVTDDGTGIAGALAEKLEARGNKVALVGYGEEAASPGGRAYCLKDDSAAEAQRVVQAVQERQGPVGGLVHLLPLRPGPPYEDLDQDTWRQGLHLQVKTLFHLLQSSGADLREAAGKDGACVLSATAMGGSWGYAATEPEGFFPGQGCVPGFLKTLALEWPEVHVKAVDLSLQETVSKLADHLLAELEAGDRVVEVGYRGPQRLFPAVSENPLEEREEGQLRIESSWVILVTGGARGITAKVARELARRYRPTLILAGRSALPPEEEARDTAALTGAGELKDALIARMKREGKAFRLADVEAGYRRLLKEREIRANFAALRKTGARVEYRQVDVRDGNRFGALIEELYRTYGRIDGVIHGAGVIEDKLFDKKTWASFDRVFGTKTESAFLLSKRLRPESLKFLALFSSIAGRFGNAGQSDYTAANNVMNKLGWYLNRKWPSRVFSIDWGPWGGGGMASDGVQRQFAGRGIELVSPEAGPGTFDLELCRGSKEEAEVVVGEGPWRALADLKDAVEVKETGLPLLQSSARVSRSNGSLVILRRFDPAHDLYLQDHCLDGKPVVPAAMAVEFMAEAAQLGWPDWNVTAVEDIRVLKGIVLQEDPVQVRLSVRAQGRMDREVEGTRLDVTLTDPERPSLAFYKGTVVLSRSLPSPQKGRIAAGSDLRPFWTSSQGAYDQWLFHGPTFQCVRSIEGISRQEMLATLSPSSPGDCLETRSQGQWLMDPVALDGGLQLALLWARNYLDITVLPSSFKAVRVFRAFHSASAIYCHLQVLEECGGQTVHYDIEFRDEEGFLLGMIERVEATGSRTLNRLTGSNAPIARRMA